MHISTEGIELIAHFEGLELEAYLCPAKVWTIGFGHTKDVKGGDKLENKMEALDLLAADLVIYENQVKKYLKIEVTQNQFDALVSFTYNLGGGAFRKSTLLRKLNKGDVEGAGREFKKWVRAGGRVLKGLVRRRKAEEELFNGN